jgi:hypothetical protein
VNRFVFASKRQIQGAFRNPVPDRPATQNVRRSRLASHAPVGYRPMFKHRSLPFELVVRGWAVGDAVRVQT